MPQSKIYIGNLSYDASQEDVENHFAPYGEVDEVKIIMDRSTGRSKGFAFVTFKNPESAEKAVDDSNGKSINGREIKVSMARESTIRGRGGRSGERERR